MAGLIGKTIGKKYELVEQLGRGAMAAVFKAYQHSLRRFVAVKILHPEIAGDETFAARFEREAHSIAVLRHPNIIQVHDFGVEAGLSFLVMDYIEGPSLKQKLKNLRDAGKLMPHSEVRRIVQDVASALDFAHSQGIIHRDIKPGNIMLTAEEDGEAILTDFGLTRILDASSLTTSGIVGTPDYLSPEQGEGETSDARSDLYSLGIVVYEMLAGQTPFAGETPVNMILKHVRGEMPAIRRLNPALSLELEAVVMKSVAHSPDDRFQSARDLVKALSEALLSSQPSVSAPTPPGRPPVQRSGRGDRLQSISREELRRALGQPLTRHTLRLTIVGGAHAGLSVPLVGRVSLGRAPGNTLVLDSAQVSRRHALITVEDDGIRITDLNSTNGTYVNQKRINSTVVQAGDVIQMGDVTLVVEDTTA